MTTRSPIVRLLAALSFGSVVASALLLSGCKTPPQDRDTNHSNYNYSYNK